MNYLIGIFLFAIGIAAIYAGKKVNRIAKKIKKFQSKQVQTIQITIVSAKAYHNSIRDPYTLNSVYSFMVNDKIYQGNVTFDVNLSNAEKAFYKGDAEKEKAEIENLNTVWYNPDDPSESFLKKTNLALFRLVRLLGYILCFSALILLLSEILN